MNEEQKIIVVQKEGCFLQTLNCGCLVVAALVVLFIVLLFALGL